MIIWLKSRTFLKINIWFAEENSKMKLVFFGNEKLVKENNFARIQRDAVLKGWPQIVTTYI